MKNVAASIRQQLLNLSRKDKRSFMELVQYYAMERFLYRLSRSSHAQSFILKGALMLRAWRSPEVRPTMDIDMLGKTSNEEHRIVKQISDVMSVNVEQDGLTFEPFTIKTERITEDADYEGIRVRFIGFLDTVRINMRIDIGFGDVVYPESKEVELPVMLKYPAPKLLCYSMESAIAEKFEAMIKLGAINSRMKDFYDIWLLSQQFSFNGDELLHAIKATFERRGTSLPSEITAFSESFAIERQAIWMSFHRKISQDTLPESFFDIVTKVKFFLLPVVKSMEGKIEFPMKWDASGPWRES